MDLQKKMAALHAPLNNKIKFTDLTQDTPYPIDRFLVTQHKLHGTSVQVQIEVGNEIRLLYLPKRFVMLASQIEELNHQIRSGQQWFLEWNGPHEQTQLVKIFPAQ